MILFALLEQRSSETIFLSSRGYRGKVVYTLLSAEPTCGITMGVVVSALVKKNGSCSWVSWFCYFVPFPKISTFSVRSSIGFGFLGYWILCSCFQSCLVLDYA